MGLRDGDDALSVGGDALAMEGGSGDAALTFVDRIFGGDEALAEEDLHAADGTLLDEVCSVGDEDLLDVAGVVEEDDGGAHETVVGDVTVGFEEIFEEADGMAELDPGPEHIERKREAEAGDYLDDPLSRVRNGGGRGSAHVRRSGWWTGAHRFLGGIGRSG